MLTVDTPLLVLSLGPVWQDGRLVYPCRIRTKGGRLLVGCAPIGKGGAPLNFAAKRAEGGSPFREAGREKITRPPS